MNTRLFSKMIPISQRVIRRNFHHQHSKERQLTELYRFLGETHMRDSEIEMISVLREIDSLESFIKNSKKIEDKEIEKNISEE